MRGQVAVVAVAVLTVVAGACSSSPAPPLERADAPPPSSALPSSTAPPLTAPAGSTTTATPPPAADPGAPTVPEAAGNPVDLAEQLARAETAVRDPSTPRDELVAMARLQQVAYRRLGHHPEWDGAVLARMPERLRPAVAANVAARRQFTALHGRPVDALPAWRIVDPEPAADLLGWYVEAERTYGVPWFYLAAINLVETGMGRIKGTSVAGAQGPMQFMPATWAAFGEGDVNDPHDAILAAARYLAHNGAPADMDGALWNYNHSWAYVRGVSHLAEVMRADTRAFYGYYHWDVYVSTTLGEVLLPVGYDEPRPVPVAEYLRRELGTG